MLHSTKAMTARHTKTQPSAWMTPKRTAPPLLAAAATVLAAVMLTATGVSRARAPSAQAAREMNVTDTAHLHLLHASGSIYTEQGTATGTLPGIITVHINVGASTTITSTFTIYPSGGSISGHGAGTLHGTGINSSFSGTMSVNSGTGHYKHAHGNGSLDGTLNRRTEALAVQTTGRLTY